MMIHNLERSSLNMSRTCLAVLTEGDGWVYFPHVFYVVLSTLDKVKPIETLRYR